MTKNRVFLIRRNNYSFENKNKHMRPFNINNTIYECFLDPFIVDL